MTQNTNTVEGSDSGVQFVTDFNAILDNLHSLHKGNTRPSYVATGMLWVDDSSDPIWIIKFYDGSDDITIATIDTTNNSFSELSERFEIKVSSNDTIGGYLEEKLLAGNGVALSTQGEGVNETRTVAVDAGTGINVDGSGVSVDPGTGITVNGSGVNVDVGTTANKILQLDGNARIPAVDGSLLLNVGGGLQSIQVFTSNGTWNKPSGITKILVFVVGGGGAGGGTSSGGGGGGTTSFGSHCSATGGGGGEVRGGGIASDGGNGGSGVSGNMNITGGGGGSGEDTENLGSMGGASFFGGGGRAPSGATGAYGGGGGGTVAGGGGGGAGGCAIKFIDVSAISSVSVTIGAGGTNSSAGNGISGAVLVLEFA